jgi:hypothetical protein
MDGFDTDLMGEHGQLIFTTTYTLIQHILNGQV